MTNLLCILIVLAAVCGQGSPQILKVTNGGPWGAWAHVALDDMCPDGSYAGGFSIRVEGSQGWDDNTALNGIRLHCVKDGRCIDSYVQTDPGRWGVWKEVKYCYEGFTRFKLRVEGKQGWGDDTAANNINLHCSNGEDMEGDGMGWGDWGHWSNSCSPGKVICGLETKVEHTTPDDDDTALNDVRFHCCHKK